MYFCENKLQQKKKSLLLKIKCKKTLIICTRQTQRWGSVAANLQRCSCALSLSKGLKRTWLTLPLFFVCAYTCTGIHLESLLRMFYSAMKRGTRTGESRLNASDHLCQCHHCICHHGMKLPRQATQWGRGGGKGGGWQQAVTATMN